MAAARWHRGLNRWWAGVLVCLLGLGLTAILVHQQLDVSRAARQTRFSHQIQATSQAVSQRLLAYTQVVASFRDLFLIWPHLSRSQFEQVAQRHAVPDAYPELVNLSFVRYVTAAELPDYERRMRVQNLQSNGIDAPFVHPPGLSGDHYIVEFLWPYQNNQGVLGLDIASQPTNLAALLTARDTDEPVLSAPFSLVQQPTAPQAVVVRYPVYVTTSDVGVAQLPRFIGAVGAVIQVQEMLDGIRAAGFLRGLSVQIFDAGGVDDPPVEQSGRSPFGASLLHAAQSLSDPLQATSQLDLLGRRWSLQYTQAQHLLSAGERWLPWWVGGTGLALSLLLGALVNSLMLRHRLAVSDVAATHQALEHSEERFRAVFNQAAIGVSLTDVRTGRLVRVNQRYASIMGYTAAELLHCSFQALTHPDDLKEDLRWMARLQAGEIPEFQLEKRMLHKDGHDIWVELTVSPILQAGAAPDYHVAVIQDVTERRRMQDALRDSEHHLRTLLDHLPVGVCLVDAQQQIVFRNQQFLQICGYDIQDMPDVRAWWMLTIPDSHDRREIRRSWERQWRPDAKVGETRAHLETLILCKDATVRLVELSGLKFGADYLMTIVDLSARKAAEEEIHYLAYNDALTDLPNRRLLVDRLEQALALSSGHRQYGALLMLDLDHFKTLNETRGHEAGDELLRQVAYRLRTGLAQAHTIARHGDDEFVIVLTDLAEQIEDAAREVESIGQQILNLLRTPYQLQNTYYHSSVSVGACLFRGRGEKVDELLRRADLAMYQAKSAGRNTLRFYDPRMQDVVHGRAALEADIRVGLEQNQFELFYQAQVGPQGIIGCEALLRWQHPRDGYVPPASFIPLAEESGLILPLGDWVLRTACQQLAKWAEDPAMVGLRVAVNVSPRQFRQADFVDQVLAALAGTGADAHLLELELTEGLLLQNLEDTVQKMERLKRYGLSFALDDFGTGYSSLAYLKRLPLDQIKIDQSFVRDVLTDPNDATIARTIVALGISLGLRVIAEGVETAEQRDFLQRHHCHTWQGYLFSRPIPLADFEALVRMDRQTRMPLI
ncbi:EAL domain-containing protein [Castellaniella sp.]|uniref:bifunctional diguanylate cyclase/phosphodiesterase n=1 Tax=Castellaniella sp. TaxID=1955812 RepID=UPI002B000F11|nr:EAL domain-containing protein [Castellaniella sp.]